MDDAQLDAGVRRPLAAARWCHRLMWVALVAGVWGAVLTFAAGEPVLTLACLAWGITTAWCGRMGSVLFGWLAAHFEQSERLAAQRLTEPDG